MSSGIVLSESEKLLLFELAKGTKTKDLIQHLTFSISGTIENREATS